MTTGILIIVLLAFGAYIYKFPPRKTSLISCSCSNKICMDYPDDTMSKLPVDLIHTMVDKYKEKQLKCINAQNDFKEEGDAHSISFDLETLKKFIYHIEKKTINTAASEGVTISNKELGIRIYYAAYPEIKDWSRYDDLVAFKDLNPIRNKYGHLHTLIMIPTITKGNRTFDFNPLDYETYANGLYDREGYYYNYSITDTTAALSFKTTNDDDGSTGAQNHGNLIPPATSGGLEGFYIP